MERMNGKKLQNYITCAYPKCGCIFSKKKLEDGTAKALGFLRFCDDSCKQKYMDMLSRQTREQD